MSSGKFTVFLADDSEDDRLFLRLALGRSSKLLAIGEARDGQETIHYLGNTNSQSEQNHGLPDVLLLDIKMPRKSGYDVLEWLLTQTFRQMKVVMISGSYLSEDVLKCSELGASAYFKKTSLRSEQDKMIQSIESLLEKGQDHS